VLRGTTLHAGDFLRPGEYLASSNHLAHLILQRDGNLVLYRTSDDSPLWSTGTNGQAVTTAAFQTDGNLVLRDAAGNPLWSSGTNGWGGDTLTLQDDGNLVMLAKGNPVWSSDTQGFVGTRTGNKTSVLTDAYNGISDAVDEAKDLINKIPGFAWATGLISDFAKTDVGKAFFRFVSPAAVPVLWTIPFVGPIVAGVSFAFPGLARGEPLATAYAAELRAAAKQFGQDILRSEFPDAADEAEQLARDAGKIAGEFPANVQTVVEGMAKNLGVPSPVDFDALVSAFAQHMNTREDLARVALDQVLGLPPLDDASLSLNYDPATGAKKKTVQAHLNVAPQVLALPGSKPTKTLHLGFASQIANVKPAVTNTKVLANSSAIRAVLNATQKAGVSPVKATAAVNLAHDTIMARPGSETVAAHLSNGGGTSADTAAMVSALAYTHAIQVLRLYVDKYLGLSPKA
jgi:hypothetical protein